MGVIINGKEVESMLHNEKEVQTWIHNGVEVYSAGKMVTYIVDTATSYEEKVKKGQSCLNPTSFKLPTYSGWAFVGWREDPTASGDVLQSKVMENAPITLYAIYQQTITLSYAGNGATSGSTSSQTGTRYWSASGNYANPTFILRSCGFAKTAYGFSRWALNSASGAQYSAGATVTLSGNATMYALWTATNGAQIWSGTIEPYGTSELTMPIVCGTYDLSGFNYLRPWLKMKNPNVSGQVIYYVYNSAGTQLIEKKYKGLQFANTATLDSMDLIDISSCGAGCTIKISRSGHDDATKIEGALYLYTTAPY